LRVGGFVLLGVAAVAAIAGLVSLAGGGAATPQNSAAPSGPRPAASQPAAPPSVAKPAPALPKPAPAGPPLVPGAPRPPVPPPPAPPPAAAPPPAQPAPAVPSPSPAPAQRGPTTTQSLPGAGLPPVDDSVPHSSGDKGATVPAVKAPVRVYNNSLIKNLAERAADQFRDSGWTVTSVGNYPFGNIPTSTVYYERGENRQREAAEYLASSFGMHAEPRFVGLHDASPGLIVILTKDFQRR
jgi:hypothetical protein